MRSRRHTAPGGLLPQGRARRSSSAAVQLQPFAPAALASGGQASYSRPRRLSHWEAGGAVTFLDDRRRTPAAAGEERDDDDAAVPEAMLPTWWIVFQFSWWAPQWITGGLLGGILIPFRIIALVGDSRKAHALAITTTVATM